MAIWGEGKTLHPRLQEGKVNHDLFMPFHPTFKTDPMPRSNFLFSAHPLKLKCIISFKQSVGNCVWGKPEEEVKSGMRGMTRGKKGRIKETRRKRGTD